MIKVKLKFLELVSVSIKMSREISFIQKEIGNLLASWQTKEQTRIQPPFPGKMSKEPSCALYVTLTTPSEKASPSIAV